MQDELMSSAVQLMALGMGTVVVFLALLVLAMNLMSAALKGFPDPPKAEVARQPGGAQAPRAAVEPEVKQAIALAITQYRREHGP